eukprot:scaffold12487_cov46-Tisochrysis_lutea.AAC.1
MPPRRPSVACCRLHEQQRRSCCAALSLVGSGCKPPHKHGLNVGGQMEMEMAAGRSRLAPDALPAAGRSRLASNVLPQMPRWLPVP